MSKHEKKIIPVAAVNAAILNSQGQVLLTRRSAKIREAGKWCLPGGHLEIGEDWVTAARREVQEEVGIYIRDPKLLGIYSDPSLTVTEVPVSKDGEFIQFLVVVFRVTEFEGEVTPNEEVDAWGWYGNENLPTPIVRSHPIRVKDALKDGGQVFVR